MRIGEASLADGEEALLDEGRPLVERTPGLLDPARLQLPAALLLDRGDDAWEAWRSYHLLHLDRLGPLPAAADTLSALLPRWAGPETPTGERLAVIRALAASALYAPALLLVHDPRVDAATMESDPRVRDIAAYARFLRQAEAVTDGYDRRTALRNGDPDAYRAALLALGQALWPRLHWAGGPPELTEERFVGEMRERPGSDVNVGHTAGFFDLHLGRIVVDSAERRPPTVPGADGATGPERRRSTHHPRDPSRAIDLSIDSPDAIATSTSHGLTAAFHSSCRSLSSFTVPLWLDATFRPGNRERTR